MGKILLYYKYIFIEDPHAIMRWQKNLCKELGLTGRILIGKEGINGTVGGTDEATQQYIESMKNHELFNDVDFKSSEGGAHLFPRLKVVIRDEIVTLGCNIDAVSPKDGGKHLTPEQVHELLSNKPDDLVILDTRNNYEWAIGTFEGAITPDIDNFRDFPQYIENNIDLFKDKRVLMFCTGGIRCERATTCLALKKVAKEVYQIKGGIHRYAEKYPDGFFRGKNYVFDGRIAMKINDDILGTCYLCQKSCDDYTNCINTLCNLQHISCSDCIKQYNNTCSKICLDKVQNNNVAIRTQPARVKQAMKQ